MRKLVNRLRKIDTLIFIDLEGTQFSHEMIALGAVKAKLDKNKQIKKLDDGFKIYVKPKERIGRFVERLTGLTPDFIEENGVPYKDAIEAFVQYAGKDFHKTLFVTFGTHDLRILNQSLLHSPDANEDDVHTIIKNNLDLSAVLNEYIRDENNNTYSLTNFLHLFNVEFEGTEHDCLCDAKNLAYLYIEALRQPEIVYDEYLKYLGRKTNLPAPISKLVKKVINEGSATIEDLKTYVREDVEYKPNKKR
jgi:inhibitor of KinA sporulation pathway (predicted exonuclease)